MIIHSSCFLWTCHLLLANFCLMYCSSTPCQDGRRPRVSKQEPLCVAKEAPDVVRLNLTLETGLAWDNYDVNMETIDDKDTFHATFGICY